MKKKRIRSTKIMDEITREIELLPQPEKAFARVNLAIRIMEGRIMRYIRNRYCRKD